MPATHTRVRQYRGPRDLLDRLSRDLVALDQEVFAGLMAEQCLNLRLCADIAADPTKLAVELSGTGWLLLFLEDGEREPITFERFADVLCYWREFVRRYLSDRPAIRRAA